MTDASPRPFAAEDIAVPTKKKRRPWQVVGIIVLFAVFGGGVAVGTRFLLTTADQAVTATDGFAYSTDTYSVVFPGEPETATQDVAGMSTSIAQWQNQQKTYMTSAMQLPARAGTLDDALAGALQSSGATLVASEEVDVPGGDAVLAQATVEGDTLWMLIAFGDDDYLFTAAQNGAEKDTAFFESFRIH
jgi:hypothetical protein